MLVQKLSWAGILVQLDETVIIIDPLGSTPSGQENPFAARLGDPLESIFPLDRIPKPTAVLITHLHADHFDHEAIQIYFSSDIPVLVPQEAVALAEKTGLKNVLGVSVGDSVTYGSLIVKAVQSMDGYGTPQVSWIVEGEQGKIIHCGDTLWHGYWWRIAREHGPIDIACLPVNGPILDVYGMPTQSGLPACMTPEEAVEAAKILGVQKLIPIHYGTFHNPPYYIETPHLMERLQCRAQEQKVNLEVLRSGQSLDLSKTRI